MPTVTFPQKNAFLCYFLALLAGAAIMMIEIGGARLLNPFFGVSLYVWTSQIAVVMLALSLGYGLGGKLADKYPSFTAVRWLLTLTSLHLLALPWLALHVLRFFGGWGLRQGALLSASILFGPPLVLLGALSPYLLRLLSDSLSTLGKKVGSLYALSTLGSMAGTIAIGYYLLPALGAHKMIYLTSLVLLLSVLCLLIFMEQKILSAALLGTLSLALLWVLLRPTPLISKTFITPQGPKNLQEVYKADSFYGKIKVIETNHRFRTLSVNGVTQAGIDTVSGKNIFQYIDDMGILGLAYAPGAKRILFLGLGAGGLEREFRTPGVKTVTVEIDPQIAVVARRYFNWEEIPGSLYIEDARFFVEKNHEPFDIIFFDCCSGESLPFHLLTRQSLTQIKRQLSPQGVMVINFPSISRLSSPLAPACLTKTLQTAFPQVKVYGGPTYTMNNEISNYIFIASLQPEEGGLFDPLRASPELAKYLSRQVEFNHPRARIIEDNYNPMDIYEQEAREIFRNRVLAITDWDFLLR